jgi:hypothetical protein
LQRARPSTNHITKSTLSNKPPAQREIMIIGPTIIAKIGQTAATTTAAAVPINAVTMTNVSLNTSGMNLLSSNTPCYSKASNTRYDITRQLGIVWHRIKHTPLTPACMDLQDTPLQLQCQVGCSCIAMVRAPTQGSKGIRQGSL